MIHFPLREDDSANAILEKYVFHSCLYYAFSTSVITDGQFDELAHALLKRWDEVTCEHKSLVDVASLKGSTSGFYLVYPSMVFRAAKSLSEKLAK